MKKGFTLIELLAVIVILSVISLITIPMILGVVEAAKKSSAVSSVYGYVDAVEKYIINSELNGKSSLTYGTYDVNGTELNSIKLKGTKPKSGSVVISKGKITSGTLIVDGYVLAFDGSEAVVMDRDPVVAANQTQYEITSGTAIDIDDNYFTISNSNSVVCKDESTVVTSTSSLSIGTHTITCTATYGNKTASDSVDVIVIYGETILNGATPVLGSGMIPVTIANDGTVTYADINSSWYNYTNKVWANAVILSSGIYTVGQVIPESAIKSYFVWIPRYKYKIFNTGNYTSLITGTPTVSSKQTIEIVFESKDATISTGSTVDSYLTHPAFTSLDVNGIWVGKFETGYLGATTTATSQVSSTDSTKIIVKPNVYSWRNNTVYNIFVSSYNYNRTLDSHMMKNTEWGAVAYLSYSIYGTNKEVNVNNNSSHKTGYSALTTTNQTTYPGTYGDGATYNTAYNTTNGYLASTTGNISGIYDMSGGAWEYMAAYMSGQLGSSGFTNTTIESYNSKYFDVYSASSTINSYNYRILGDASAELGPFYSYADGDSTTRNHNSWYADLSSVVFSTYPWVFRGGMFSDGVLTGQFNFNRGDGGVYTVTGSRLVLSIN